MIKAPRNTHVSVRDLSRRLVGKFHVEHPEKIPYFQKELLGGWDERFPAVVLLSRLGDWWQLADGNHRAAALWKAKRFSAVVPVTFRPLSPPSLLPPQSPAPP